MNVDNQEEKTARFLYFLLSITFKNKLFIIWFLYFSKFHLYHNFWKKCMQIICVRYCLKLLISIGVVSDEFETRSCNCSSKYENFGCKLFVDLHLMACYVGKKIIKIVVQLLNKCVVLMLNKMRNPEKCGNDASCSQVDSPALYYVWIYDNYGIKVKL